MKSAKALRLFTSRALQIMGGDMKKLFLIVTALMTLLSLPASASTYSATFTSFFDVFADITVDGGNNVTAISGTVIGPGGGTITNLASNSSWSFDQKFDGAGNPYVSNGGILFAAGAYLYNLYSTGSGPFTYLLSTNNPNGVYDPGQVGLLDVSQTPIPAPFLLLASVLAIGGLLFRSRRQYGNEPSGQFGPV